VRLAEAIPMTGGITLDLLNIEGATLPTGRTKPGRYQPKKPGKFAAKDAATKRKLVRKRR